MIKNLNTYTVFPPETRRKQEEEAAVVMQESLAHSKHEIIPGEAMQIFKNVAQSACTIPTTNPRKADNLLPDSLFGKKGESQSESALLKVLKPMTATEAKKMKFDASKDEKQPTDYSAPTDRPIQGARASGSASDNPLAGIAQFSFGFMNPLSLQQKRSSVTITEVEEDQGGK